MSEPAAIFGSVSNHYAKAKAAWYTLDISHVLGHLETKFQRPLHIFEETFFNGDSYFFTSLVLTPEVNMATVTLDGAREFECSAYGNKNFSKKLFSLIFKKPQQTFVHNM